MSFLSDIFGGKPQVAGYQDINLGQEQQLALGEDITAWPQIEQMGNLYQQYMLDSYKSAGFDLSSILGAAHGDISTALGQAGQELRGQIPADVAAQVQRSSAFQNLMSGAAGSPMADANTARNYGLTSLDLINRGASLLDTTGNAAQRWSNIAGQTIMSPAGFVITPAQQAAMTQSNRLIQRQIQQERYNVAAAPNPWEQALNQWVEQVGGTAIGSYLGQLGGGGGGAGKGGGGGGGSYMTTAPSASSQLGGGQVTGGNIGGGGQVDLNIGSGVSSTPQYAEQSSLMNNQPVNLWGAGINTPTSQPFQFGSQYYDQYGQFSPFQQGTGI